MMNEELWYHFVIFEIALRESPLLRNKIKNPSKIRSAGGTLIPHS